MALNNTFMKYILMDVWDWCKDVSAAAFVGICAAFVLDMLYLVSPLVAFIVAVVFIGWLFER